MSAVVHENPVTQAGFTQIPNVVMLNPDLSMQAKIVYGYLTHLSWRNGNAPEVEPPLQTLCRDLGASENTMRRYLAELKMAKLLETKRRGLGLSNQYVILDPPNVVDGNADLQDQDTPEQRIPPNTKELRPKKDPLQAKPAMKEPDIVWDCLVEVTGFDPTTTSEKGDFGKTVSELRAVIPKDATVDEVRRAMRGRRTAWERDYPDAKFTHRILRGKWSELGSSLVASRPFDPYAGLPPVLPDGEIVY